MSSHQASEAGEPGPPLGRLRSAQWLAASRGASHGAAPAATPPRRLPRRQRTRRARRSPDQRGRGRRWPTWDGVAAGIHTPTGGPTPPPSTPQRDGSAGTHSKPALRRHRTRRPPRRRPRHRRQSRRRPPRRGLSARPTPSTWRFIWGEPKRDRRRHGGAAPPPPRRTPARGPLGARSWVGAGEAQRRSGTPRPERWSAWREKALSAPPALAGATRSTRLRGRASTEIRPTGATNEQAHPRAAREVRPQGSPPRLLAGGSPWTLGFGASRQNAAWTCPSAAPEETHSPTQPAGGTEP